MNEGRIYFTRAERERVPNDSNDRMPSPVDVDDRSSWPPRVTEAVGQWAERYRGTTKYTSDLALPLEAEGPFRDLLAGRLLRAYHCTRLLPHEVETVRTGGLRPLTAELIRDRIDAARTHGSISPTEASQLREAHVFATGEQRNRERQVCLILSKRVFRENPQGCEPLLTTWGGEGMYMSSRGAPLRDRFGDLGSPAVVIALLDLGRRNLEHSVFPALHKVFVGAALGLAGVWADVFYRSAVLPEHLERILQPGDPDFEGFGCMPARSRP